MDLKNAAIVCLISLFSATLVVLIARSLDSQAAAQLEPQLTAIAEELRAIRRQGGMRSDDAAQPENVGNGLVVYYFHSNKRCPNCQAIESQTKALLETDFATQLKSEDIVWKVLNYEKRLGTELARKFEVTDPVVVLARMKDNQIGDWTRLDKVMALVGDKPAFADYVRGEIKRMLAAAQSSSAPATEDASPKDTPAIPIPQ